jgi:hypothetical protein
LSADPNLFFFEKPKPVFFEKPKPFFEKPSPFGPREQAVCTVRAQIADTPRV